MFPPTEAATTPIGIKPGEGSKKPERAAKYRGPQGELWTGVGAMAGWLKKLRTQVKILKGFASSLEISVPNIIF
jgi:DNA-binding protein H-NS